MSQRLIPHDLMLEDICNEVLEIDNCIRFAGFANNMGKIIAAQYRGESVLVERERLLFVNERGIRIISYRICVKNGYEKRHDSETW